MKRIWTILRHWKTAQVVFKEKKEVFLKKNIKVGTTVLVFYEEYYEGLPQISGVSIGVWKWNDTSKDLITNSDNLKYVMMFDHI